MAIEVSSSSVVEVHSNGMLRVVFTHEFSTGEVIGPYVDYRPSGEDVAAWLSTSAQALIDALTAAEVEGS